MDYIESLGLGAYCTHQRKKNRDYSIYDIDEFSVMSGNKRFLVNPFIFIEESDEFLNEKINLANIYNLKIIGKNIENLKNLSEFNIMNIIELKDSNIDYEALENIENNAYNPYNFIDELIDKNRFKNLLYSDKLGLYTENNYSVLEAIRYELNNNKIFTLRELFYMSTVGSGKFFGNIGKFNQFYSFDANIIDDSEYSNLNDDLEERLNNFVKYGKKEDIILRDVYGMKALGE
ncbi:MAG: hypothetical protein Q4P31_02360 [Andreesenia angusta]|nr:hypothetical protein [Andreesenia angusta]